MGMFVDCAEPEDQKLIALYQDILAGRKDVSSLDNEYGLTLAVDIPKAVLEANGTSDRLFGVACYSWRFYDINYLLKDSKPGEAVPIGDAGFSEDDLVALGKPDQYLAYVRNLEEYAGEPKGHYFPVELEKQSMEFERKHSAKVRLRQKLLGLRSPRSRGLGDTSRPAVPEGTRNEVLQFHDYCCVFDGRTRPEFPIHVHHIIPQRLIERLSLPARLFTARENLVACCSGCNIAKSDELSKADVRFYLSKFSGEFHPNNPLLPFLQRIRDLQEDSR